MRVWFRVAALSCGIVLATVSSSHAYKLNLVPEGPGDWPLLGDIYTFAVWLDTEGESGIDQFSVSLTFDPAQLLYREDLSASHSYYPLYAPAAGPAGPTWLEPVPLDGLCPVEDPLCGTNAPQLWTGTQPAIGGRVDVEFRAANGLSTTATTTSLLIARLAFEVVGFGTTIGGEWGFGQPGDEFVVDGVDIAPGSDIAQGSGPSIPEPSTAVLVGVGLAGLAATRRRRGR